MSMCGFITKEEALLDRIFYLERDKGKTNKELKELKKQLSEIKRE